MRAVTCSKEPVGQVSLNNEVLLIWRAGIGGGMFNIKLLLSKNLPASETTQRVTETSSRPKRATRKLGKSLFEPSIEMKPSERDLLRFLCETHFKAV